MSQWLTCTCLCVCTKPQSNRMVDYCKCFHSLLVPSEVHVYFLHAPNEIRSNQCWYHTNQVLQTCWQFKQKGNIVHNDWLLMWHPCPTYLYFFTTNVCVQLCTFVQTFIKTRQINIESAKRRTRNRHADTETQSCYWNLWSIQKIAKAK